MAGERKKVKMSTDALTYQELSGPAKARALADYLPYVDPANAGDPEGTFVESCRENDWRFRADGSPVRDEELEELPDHSSDILAVIGPADETVRVMLPVLFCFNVRRTPGEPPADFDGRVTDTVTNYLGILGDEDETKCTLMFSYPDGKDLEAHIYPSDHAHCDTFAWIPKEREAIEQEARDEYEAAADAARGFCPAEGSES
jgi:hypothetical protein